MRGVSRSSSAPVSLSDPKTSKSSSAPVGDRGTKPSSSIISRLRRDSYRWRLSSRLSSLASSGPLYLVFTGATPQRGPPAGEAAWAYCAVMTTWSVAGATSPRASLSM